MNNDLISRSALLESAYMTGMWNRKTQQFDLCVVDFEDVQNAPAVDAEVVRHGKWIADAYSIATGIDEYEEEFYVVCSECGRTEHADGYDDASALKFAAKEYPYCHCGCKMDAEVEGNA